MALPIIETPKYETTIPSTGKKVQYRPYLVREEKILMIAMEADDQTQIVRAMKEVIKACTFDKVDPDKLCTFDLEYLFLKLRAKSVGEVSKVGLKCEKCDQPTNVTINLDEITIDMQKKPESKIMLTDKIGVNLSWPKISTVETIETKDNAPKMESAMQVIVSCIESIFDEKKIYPANEQSAEELVTFVESLNQSQFGKIQQFIEDMPKLQKEITFKCCQKECAHENKVMLSGIQSFFA